jgi:hypothetical protein
LRRVDLHIHSTASDGTATPEEVAFLAGKGRLDLVALTDHDTTTGLPEFLEACDRLSLMGLTGIELSAEAPYTLHILGYGIIPGSPVLERHLCLLRERRRERNEAVRLRLADLGCPLEADEIEREACGDVVARPHIARALVRRGYVPDMTTAFRRFLGRDGAAYVPRRRLDAESCIETIGAAGGVASLAHPIQTGLDDVELKRLLFRLKDAGLWGLECYSARHAAAERFRFLRLAAEMGLEPTAGSDYHGANRPDVDLGVEIEESHFPYLFLMNLASSREGFLKSSLQDGF